MIEERLAMMQAWADHSMAKRPIPEGAGEVYRGLAKLLDESDEEEARHRVKRYYLEKMMRAAGRTTLEK